MFISDASLLVCKSNSADLNSTTDDRVYSRSPVCLGAFLIIAGLAIDPLTQQTVGYPLRLFPSSGGLAILNRTESIQDDILEDPFHDLRE